MFFGVMLSALIGLMHLYLWKRLVKDTTRPGRRPAGADRSC